MRHILVFAFMMSPAFADVYRCDKGGKTIYQDVPCANAKLIDNINAQVPPREEQIKAMERAARDRALLAQQTRASRYAERDTVTLTQTKVPAPVTPRPNGHDRYYDRPDKFRNRTETSHTIIRRQ